MGCKFIKAPSSQFWVQTQSDIDLPAKTRSFLARKSFPFKNKLSNLSKTSVSHGTRFFPFSSTFLGRIPNGGQISSRVVIPSRFLCSWHKSLRIWGSICNTCICGISHKALQRGDKIHKHSGESSFPVLAFHLSHKPLHKSYTFHVWPDPPTVFLYWP